LEKHKLRHTNNKTQDQSGDV